MPRTAQVVLIGALLSVGEASLAQVDVYRWVDADGVVHFSDTRRSASDEHFELVAFEPSPEAVESHLRLMDQQLELIALLEESRRSRTEQMLESQRQNVELARARLALAEERNAAAAEQPGYDYGYAYPVPYSYGYAWRQGYRRGYGFGDGNGKVAGWGEHRGEGPGSGYASRGPGRRGPGHGRSRPVISKPFITD